MRKKWIIALALLLSGCAGNGYRKGPTEPVSHFSHFDYALKIDPASGNTKQLSDFKGKKFSLFYLSPACPHCKAAVPIIEKARKVLDSLGYERINLCIKFSTDDQFISFIRDENLRGYNFKDTDRNFALKYGTGVVPVFAVVNDSGEMTRYNFVGDTLANQVRADLAACCKDQ